MPSPTSVWCDWFDSLTPAVSREIAVALTHLCPGGMLNAPLITPDPTDGFVARVRRLAANPMQDAGVALMLGSLTDFIFLERSTPGRWEKNRRMLEILEDAQEAYVPEDDQVSEQLAEWIESTKLRHPLRARQWVKEFERWRELREGALGIEAINRSVYDMLSGG